MFCMMPAQPAGSSPAMGSSRISTRGRMAITPAMATRRFWPPESSSGLRSKSSSPTPVRRAASRTRSSISPSPSFMLRGPKEMSLYTVSSKSWYSGYWKTRPTLKRTSRVASLLAKMSSPST